MRTPLLILAVAGLLLSTSGHAADVYQGFGDTYIVQKGDLNGDGRLDLHIRYRPHVTIVAVDDLTIPIGHPSPVGDFVLQQNTSGGFDLITSLNATQKAAIAAWATATVRVVIGDFNVDGLMDVLLSNVSGAISGAQDVFVFAPTTAGAAPAVARAWDATLNLFLRDVAGWTQDPQHYYDPGMEHACIPQLVWVRVTRTDAWGNTWTDYELQQVTVCGDFLNVANYSVPALQFLRSFVVSLVYGEMPPGYQDTVDVSQRFKSIFGVPLMRDTLETGTQNFGLSGDLVEVLNDCPRADTQNCTQVFDRLRLVRFFYEFVRKTAAEKFCDSGVQHNYDLIGGVCNAGAPGCNVSNVYNTEMLVHPVTGYWNRSHSRPFQNGEKGYAELGCSADQWYACDPLYGSVRGLEHFGIFDGGPIQVFRFDAEYRHVNQTLEGHLFYNGSVDRKARLTASGGVEIYTVGTGNGKCSKLNKYGGMYLFFTVDKFIQCHLAGGCNPVP